MDAQTRLLRDIGLSYQTLQQLTAQNIVTCRDVLLMSSIDLMELLNMTYLQAEGLLDHVASHTAPSYVTVSNKLSHVTHDRLGRLRCLYFFPHATTILSCYILSGFLSVCQEKRGVCCCRPH
eukprot:GHUV01050348.1.p2 GENE.GHUV01050348.1~~GHUV01050348.1.p2  ORF type:complete len:122 (+),score=0.11 GHUV01050348.1:305-670(+)